MKKKIIIEKFIFKELKMINQRYNSFDKKTNFFDEGMDSLDFFKLIFKIEKKFKIAISSKNYKKLTNVNNLVNFILKK